MLRALLLALVMPLLPLLSSSVREWLAEKWEQRRRRRR